MPRGTLVADYIKWASNSMSWFQLTQRKLMWFQEHARLPEAQWSHNGNHRQNCRLTGHKDDRLSTKQTKKHWMFARLLPLTSVSFLCRALVFIPWAYKKKAITNTVLEKHTGYFFMASWRFLRVYDKKDHLFPTARTAWDSSAVYVRCSGLKKHTHLMSLKMMASDIALAVQVVASLKTHVHQVTVAGMQGEFGQHHYI